MSSPRSSLVFLDSLFQGRGGLGGIVMGPAHGFRDDFVHHAQIFQGGSVEFQSGGGFRRGSAVLPKNRRATLGEITE